MAQLYECPYFRLELDERTRVVRYVRTTEPFESAAAAGQTFAAMRRSLASIDRSSLALLLDLRDGPPRNDAAFEQIVNEETSAAIAGFRARATLVRTAVGALQVRRLARERGGEAHVFHDEAEAEAFLVAR